MRHGLVLAGILAISGTAFGADPKLMNLVMPDAKVVAGANVASAKISPLGQYIISELQGNGAQLRGLIAAAGFDPFTDITEVIAATAADPGNPSGLVLMDGAFNVTRIVGALQSGNSTSTQANVQTYAGATLITFVNPNAKATPAVAFIGNGIALAGDAATVQAALDRSSGANSIDPGLAARVNALSGSDDVWMVGDAPISSLFSGNAAASGGGIVQALQMLQNIQSYSAAVKLGDSVQTAVQVQANSAENAEALGNVFKLVVSLGSMNAASDPQTASLMKLLQSLQVSTSGQNVDIALTVPEAQMEGLIKSIAAPAKTPKGN